MFRRGAAYYTSMLFDLFNGPVVELVDVKASQVTFRSRKPLASGRPVAVRLSTGNGRAVPVKVSVTASRPLGQGYACSAYLEQAVDLPEFGPLAGGDPFLRQASRLDCRLRVVSPALPGFKAVTIDFSTGGLQVEAQGEVQVGTELPIRLEFDSVPTLECQARVAWCRALLRGRVLLGLQFVHLTPESRASLAEFEQFLLARDKTSLLKRSLGAEQPAGPPCGTVVSYGVEGAQVTVVFRTSQGPTLRMRFSDYRGITDRRAAGRSIQALRDVPGNGCTRYQFLDEREQVVLEVLATDCCSET